MSPRRTGRASNVASPRRHRTRAHELSDSELGLCFCVFFPVALLIHRVLADEEEARAVVVSCEDRDIQVFVETRTTVAELVALMCGKLNIPVDETALAELVILIASPLNRKGVRLESHVRVTRALDNEPGGVLLMRRVKVAHPASAVFSVVVVTR